MFEWIKTLIWRVKLGSQRSPKWEEVRNDYLKDNPICAVCGTKKRLNIHHCVPFHINPSKELDKNNLITLCRSHHLLFGHLMDWKKENFDVINDSKIWNKKITA